MKALKMKVIIGRDRRLLVEVPEGFREGTAELILLAPEEPEEYTPTGLEAHLRHLLANPRNRTCAELNREILEQRKNWE